MTNTLENKAKFFSQYWGQDVAWLDRHQGYPLEKDIISWYSMGGDIHYLELKQLSQISDEDAIEVANIFNIGHLKGSTLTLIKSILSALDGSTPKSETTEFVLNWLSAQDYLRSRGYALPWMGISVETLVEWGWVKLKSND